LTVLDKSTGIRRLVPARAVGVIRDFYRSTSGAPPQLAETEQELGLVEGAAAASLRQIDAGVWPLPPAERDQLALFLSLQLLRDQRFRTMLHQIETMHDDINAALRKPQVVRALFRGSMQREAAAAELDDLLEMGKNPPWLLHVGQDEVLAEMLALAPIGAITLATRSWTLITSRDDHFITSMEPVTVWSPPLPNGRPRPVGIETADEVTFPIGPRHCLLMNRPGALDDAAVAGPISTRSINERHFIYAGRFVYQLPSCTFELDGSAC